MKKANRLGAYSVNDWLWGEVHFQLWGVVLIEGRLFICKALVAIGQLFEQTVELLILFVGQRFAVISCVGDAPIEQACFFFAEHSVFIHEL